MTQPSTVLVLGARGRFGLAATRAFAAAGWRVFAQIRPGASGPANPGVTWLAAQRGIRPAWPVPHAMPAWWCRA